MNKLSTQTMKRLIGLHGWSGAILSALLYTIILTGTVVVFDLEILRWSEGYVASSRDLNKPLDETIHKLAQQVPKEQLKNVRVSRIDGGDVHVVFSMLKKRPNGRADNFGRVYVVDYETQSIKSAKAGFFEDLFKHPPSEALEDFLVELHVALHIPRPWGLYATGVLGVVLLVAAITGVLIHRHIIRDMFVTKRPGNRVVSVRDKHNLAGLWGLPFAVLLAFTGAFLSFAVSLGLPIVAMSAFGGDQQAAIEAVRGLTPPVDERRIDTINLDVVVADATNRHGRLPRLVEIENYGRADARVKTIHLWNTGDLTGTTLEYSGTTGEYIGTAQLVGSAPSAGSTLVSLMAPLHFGTFAGYFSKVIWAALGAAMCVTVVSGMQLWLRRRSEEPSWIWANTALSAVVWGLPLAMVGSAYGYFFTLLNGDPTRWTANGFLIVMVIVFIAAFCIRPLPRLSRYYQSALGYTLFFLPLVRLQTGGLSWGEAILLHGIEVLFIDSLCLITGFILVKREISRLKAKEIKTDTTFLNP